MKCIGLSRLPFLLPHLWPWGNFRNRCNIAHRLDHDLNTYNSEPCKDEVWWFPLKEHVSFDSVSRQWLLWDFSFMVIWACIKKWSQCNSADLGSGTTCPYNRIHYDVKGKSDPLSALLLWDDSLWIQRESVSCHTGREESGAMSFGDDVIPSQTGQHSPSGM